MLVVLQHQRLLETVVNLVPEAKLSDTVADSGGVRGVQMPPPPPPLAASNVFFAYIIINCTSLSNDYAGVVCSNNNQA